MLHIVNKSPAERTTLASCLRIASGGALLLIEDGVYAACARTPAAASLREAMSRFVVYALQPDVEARGLSGATLEGIRLVGYDGFVDLVAEHRHCQSWL